MRNQLCDGQDGQPRETLDEGRTFKPLDLVILLLRYKWLVLATTVIAALVPLVLNVSKVSLPSTQHPSLKADYNYAHCTIAAKERTAEYLAEALQSAKVRDAVADRTLRSAGTKASFTAK